MGARIISGAYTAVRFGIGLLSLQVGWSSRNVPLMVLAVCELVLQVCSLWSWRGVFSGASLAGAVVLLYSLPLVLLWSLEFVPVHPVLTAVQVALCGMTMFAGVWMTAKGSAYTCAAIVKNKLVDSGPFRFCRHPQAALRLLTIPVVAYSVKQPLEAVFYVAISSACVMIVTYWEETFWRSEEYTEYAKRVPFRFFPGIY